MNELSVYERIADPLAAVREMGEAIAKSRLFGCESLEQGKVFAWECLARRCPPLSLTETYHVIDGRLSMRADAMLARFREVAGHHEIVERSPDRAAIRLYQEGVLRGEFSFTWQEAQAEGLENGKSGIKTNWSTPRRRMQMLWARVCSDAVRAVAPEVCAGKYTPEDFGRVADDDHEPADVTSPLVVDGQATVTPPTPPATPPAPTPPANPPPPPPIGESTPITAAQKERIRDLVLELDATAALEKGLAKRGVNSINSLMFSDAAEIINKLWSLSCQRRADATAGASTLPQDARQAENAGPCTQSQVDQAKRLLAEMKQVMPDVIERVKAKLMSAGLAVLADMSMGDMERFVCQLDRRNIEEFFAASLTKPAAKN